MKTSPTIANLAKALLKAQTQMGAAVKGSKNPFFKSNYADLPTVMEVMKGPLNENGLLVLQPAAHIDGRNFIETVIVHAESGEWISSETEVICSKQNDPQSFGAAQTYARRFGLQSMGFIPAEDDDGNTAAGRSATAAKSYTAPVATAAPAPTVAKQLTDAVSSSTTETKAPLKSSSFSKTKKPVAEAPKAAETVASSDGWN